MAKYRHAKGPSALQVIVIILVIVLSIALLGGAAFAVYHFAFDKEEEIIETTPTKTTPATVEQVATEAPTEDPELRYTTLAQEYLDTMTEDEKIYQMLVVTPEALTGVDVATVAGDATKEAIETYPVGGIVYSADNFEDEKQTTELIKNSQSYAKTPMLIGVCEEGGENSPVASKLDTQKRFEESIYAKEGDQTILNYAGAIAKNLSTYGFNFNLAPSANLEGENSFQNDEKSDMLCSAVKGFNSNGVIATLKTFPTAVDTDSPTDQLRATAFVPFSAGIDAGADVVMVGDIKASVIDNDNPAFMSKNVVTELLVKELKFSGVVITPDLSNTTYTADEVVSGAIGAGANILLCPADIDEYVDSIKAALKDGTITQDQIDESVTKILALKYKYGIIPEPVTPTPSEINTQDSTQSSTLGTLIPS